MKNRVSQSRVFQGIVKRHPDGFGFVLPIDPEQEDVFISRGDMVGVMTNDKVEVEVHFSKATNKTYGKVRKILERGTKKVVGKYQKLDNGDGALMDKVGQWGAILKIPFKQSNSAANGDLVAVEIVQYPTDDGDFTGRVVEIIGDPADPLNDITRVVHMQGIPDKFSKGALQDAEAIPDHVLPEETKNREDLRDLPFITIDGVTAKDFDDAVYVRQTPKGFQLWVAIADVSHYVKAGSDLDKDAYERGTSVYFPNFVVPMLPEKLSNELCSLKPKVDRLSFVCEMQLAFDGHVTDAKVYEAVIHSHARVTYGEAQDILTGDKDHAVPEVTKNIRTASDLAKILMGKRMREGSLEINVGETSIVVDDAGNPTDVIRSERLFAHRLIEELMLIANVSVAKILHENDVPAIYRIHEEPDAEDIQKLDKFLHNFGSSQKKLGSSDLQKRLTKSLQEFEGKPEGIVLNMLTLRSMKQAKYSEGNVGHFGLGFEFYTHFTSPIRRYPDLIVHRLLKSIKINSYRAIRPSEEKLASAGVFLSACEQRAVKAERMVVSIKKARFMKQHEGEIFEGVISSVARFGVFVLLRQFDIDGLVKSENLGSDAFEFDEDNLTLRGKKTGLMYKIGDTLKIQVAEVHIDEGQIDFTLEGGSLKSNTRIAKPWKNERSVTESPFAPRPSQPNGKLAELLDKKGRGKKHGSFSKNRNAPEERRVNKSDRRVEKFTAKPVERPQFVASQNTKPKFYEKFISKPKPPPITSFEDDGEDDGRGGRFEKPKKKFSNKSGPPKDARASNHREDHRKHEDQPEQKKPGRFKKFKDKFKGKPGKPSGPGGKKKFKKKR